MVSGAMISGLRNLICLLFNNNQIFIFCLCIVVVFFLLIFGIKCLSKINFLMVIFLLFVAVMLVLNIAGQGVKILFENNGLPSGFSFKKCIGLIFLIVSYVLLNGILNI
jgi:purine-cytosine permease-like protein